MTCLRFACSDRLGLTGERLPSRDCRRRSGEKGLMRVCGQALPLAPVSNGAAASLGRSNE
jgi:hypothetical protein